MGYPQEGSELRNLGVKWVGIVTLPYAYYEFVRWGAMLGFALLAYHNYERKAMTTAIVLAGLALLFQPFERLLLGRTLWNVVDVIVAGYLLYLASITIRSPVVKNGRST